MLLFLLRAVFREAVNGYGRTKRERGGGPLVAFACERRRVAAEQRPTPIGTAKDVLDALPWQAIPVEQVLSATGLELGLLMLVLEQLENDGWVSQRSGWIERIGRGGAR